MILVVAFLVTALILPVYGLTGDTWPENTDVKTILASIVDTDGDTLNLTGTELQTGSPVYFYNTGLQATQFSMCSYTFTVPTSGATVWIGSYNNAGTWYPDPNYIGTLSQYYDQSVSYEGSLVYVHRYTMNMNTGMLDGTRDNQTMTTFVSCYKNVPAGQYTVSYNTALKYAPVAVFIDESDIDTGGGDDSGGSGAEGTTEIIYPMGSARYAAWESLLNAIANYNGSANSIQAVLSRIEELSKWGDLLGVSMADYALNLLAERGGLTSGNITGFIADANDVLDQLSNEELLPGESAVELSNLFSEYLEKCATVSEAMLLGTTYTAWNQKLLILSLFGVDDEPLVPGLSQEEQDKVNSYYDKEEALLNEFNKEQFSASIDLSNYIGSLNMASASSIKDWFDWLFTKSFFTPFIMIPLSCLLMTILLGTTYSLTSGIISEQSYLRNRRIREKHKKGG